MRVFEVCLFVDCNSHGRLIRRVFFALKLHFVGKCYIKRTAWCGVIHKGCPHQGAGGGFKGPWPWSYSLAQFL